MAIPTLRILTRKSTMGFGKYKDYRVQDMLDLGRKLDLISPYYRLTSINYTEDILVELKITDEWVIVKPGSNKEMHARFLKDRGYRRRRGGGADKLQGNIRYSKYDDAQRNQGH
jgi:hypothetical protein